MNKRNVEMLSNRLQQLGFGDEVKYRIMANACFAPAHFEVAHQIELGADTCDFQVHCGRGEQGMYDAIYFIASLRKMPEVPNELASIDESMQSIKWGPLYQSRESMTVGDFVQDAFTAAELLQSVMSVDIEGVIRFRHWSGTPLEPLVPNLNYLKSQYEISQRFYLIDDATPISFTDAMRFLQSRWLERRLNSDRKLLIKKDRTGTDTNNSGSGRGLLTKRIKPNRSPGRNNRKL